MPPRLSWRKLLPGILALGAVVATALGVLLFAGIGQIRGEKKHVFFLSDQARGVMRGTEVWLAGQKIGLVDRVEFRAPSNDVSGRVIIAATVRAHDADQIRRDSRAQVRAGTSLISPAVVYLSAGTPGSPSLGNGDTLRAHAQSDLELAGTKLSAATADLGPMIADARIVFARIHDTSGTIGAMLHEGPSGKISTLRTRFVQLREQTFGGEVDLSGRANLATRMRGALARVDSVRALLASPRSSFGRFRRDSTLGSTVAALRDELTVLQITVDSADGNLKRFKSDSALTRSVEDSRRAMSQLFDDIRRRPFHYVHF